MNQIIGLSEYAREMGISESQALMFLVSEADDDAREFQSRAPFLDLTLLIECYIGLALDDWFTRYKARVTGYIIFGCQ